MNTNCGEVSRLLKLDAYLGSYESEVIGFPVGSRWCSIGVLCKEKLLR